MHVLISHRCSGRILRNLKGSLTSRVGSMTSKKSDDDIELPPEPTTCCMSGCSNCVWIAYAEELVKLYEGNSEKAQEIILKKINDPTLKMFLRVELQTLQYKEKEKDSVDK